jgi:hypothetical protein
MYHRDDDGEFARCQIGLLVTFMLLMVFWFLSACTTTRTPPPAPEAVQVLVPIKQPCVPAKVERQVKPVDDPAILEADFATTVKGVVKSWLMETQENTKLRAANDRPCGSEGDEK